MIHCASVGEVEAAKPLVEALLTHYPQTPITITCTTPTGSERIQKCFSERVNHCYLPIDTPGAVKRWLKALQPRAIILLETELWPNLLMQARQANCQTFLVNARLSQKSARAYRRFYWFTALMLNHLDGILAQNQACLRRYRALGYSNPITLTGSLKFDLTPPEHNFNPSFTASLQQRILWVAGSTHSGEDEALIQAFQHLKDIEPRLLLVLVPRHPERFEPLVEMLKKSGLSAQRFSQTQQLEQQTQVLLGDTMGDLVRWYQLADWVFIGGSLIPRGGHNPLEAMIFGKPIMTGRHIFNFAEIYRQLAQHQALSWIDNPQQLIQQAQAWLSEPQQAKTAGQRAQALFNRHQGATLKTLAQLKQQLGKDLPHQALTKQSHNHIWFDHRYLSKQQIEQAFNPTFWQTQNKIIGHSHGRNQAWFIQHQDQTMLLRHYYRGGLIGKLLNDQFLTQPAANSRAFQEFKLLSWMRAQGLAVPRPCAARYESKGIIYRADILVEVIPNSQDLFQTLCQQALEPQIWQQIGQMIARFHQQGIYHSDLNCHNILLDQQNQAWLIDFDKCERRLAGNWTHANLTRLKRSLEKEKKQHKPFYYHTQDWQALKLGYTGLN